MRIYYAHIFCYCQSEKGNGKAHMTNFFYLAADGRRQKLDGVLYRLPTWHPIYSMPFGQSKNFIYSPARAEYLIGGNVAGYQKDYPSVFVCFCPHLSSASGRQNNYRSFDKTVKTERRIV